MAFPMNYDLPTHMKFVGSFRRSSFDGKFILGVEVDVDDGIRECLEGKGVTPKELNIANCMYVWEQDNKKKDKRQKEPNKILERNMCAVEYPNIKVRWSRFPLQRDLLRACSDCTGPGLISDFRNIIFQNNPFGRRSPPVQGLQVFEEHRSITTDHWLVQHPVKDCKGVMFWGRTILFSCTTVGTWEEMLRYLDAMYDEMRVWIADPKCHFGMNGDDQFIHNYLLYTGGIPFAVAVPDRTGIVHTAGAQGEIIHKAHQKNLKEKNLHKEPFDSAQKGGTWIGVQYDLTDD